MPREPIKTFFRKGWGKLRLVFFTLALTSLPLVTSQASPLPQPTNYVNDHADVLSQSEEDRLNTGLKTYEDSTTNQIFVAIVQDLGGQDIESYAGSLYSEWKIGQKGKDNGILILVSINDDIRRIEIGYGLEGDITDGQAGAIIRQALKPAFQSKNYFNGLAATIDLIQKEIGGEIIPENSDSPPRINGSVLLVFFIILLQLISAIVRWLAKSKSVWQGGLIGAIAGIIVGIAIASLFVGAITMLIFAILGILLDLFLSRTYKPGTLRPLHASPWFWGGGGGGGFGGGGFGGGGGGGSGGGGASG